jgi:acyl carrier protein
MHTLDPTPIHPASVGDFEAGLLHFINETLPSFDRRGSKWPHVSADTLLFATGVLDSLSILHLMGAIEDLTGRAVPDHMVVMKHFRSVEAICAAFWTQTHSDQP